MEATNQMKKTLKYILIISLVFIAASFIGYIFQNVGFYDTNIVVVYLLAVLIIAWLTRSFIYGFIASFLAAFLFNYLFIDPIFAVHANSPNYIITLIIMTFTALIASILTLHAKKSALTAIEKENETKAIYNFTNRLASAKDLHDISYIVSSAINDCFACNAVVLCLNENNMPAQKDGFYDWPINGSENILGTIRISKEKAEAMNEPQKRLISAVIESAALVIDRFYAAEHRIKAREEVIKERYRGNLLRAISHDIRTPLSGMKGTTEILLATTSPQAVSYELVRSIQNDIDWLHSMVENILSLTRLHDGKLTVNKQLELVEEIIGGAINQTSTYNPERHILANVPDEPLFVPMDAILIKQVIVNLLDNAIKHTKAECEISIVVSLCNEINIAEFVISDTGIGIPEKDLTNIFEMYYTSHKKEIDTKHGIGLGLTLCETIVKAHGGNIMARNRATGIGAEFVFTLPMEVENEQV